MEKSLQNLEIWCWRYLENGSDYPGLHFTAKPAACDALAICLSQLQSGGDVAYRTIPLRQLRPEDERKVTGGQKFESFSKLRVTIHSESEHLRQMSFRVEDGLVRFDFTIRSLPEFEQGLSDVKSGTGDYTIRPRKDRKSKQQLGELDQLSECLWFWPCFGHLHVVD